MVFLQQDQSSTAFLSYAREDLDAALWIYEEIKKSSILYGIDIRPWIDKRDIIGGILWEDAILDALDNSDFFILLLSCNSVTKAGYVQKEITEALRRFERFPPGHISLIPVRLDSCVPPHRELRKIQWIDLFPNKDIGVKKIMASIQMQVASTSKQHKVMKNPKSTNNSNFKQLKNDIEEITKINNERRKAVKSWLDSMH